MFLTLTTIIIAMFIDMFLIATQQQSSFSHANLYNIHNNSRIDLLLHVSEEIT